MTRPPYALRLVPTSAIWELPSPPLADIKYESSISQVSRNKLRYVLHRTTSAYWQSIFFEIGNIVNIIAALFNAQ